jgi:hypothetical protein
MSVIVLGASLPTVEVRAIIIPIKLEKSPT